ASESGRAARPPGGRARLPRQPALGGAVLPGSLPAAASAGPSAGGDTSREPGAGGLGTLPGRRGGRPGGGAAGLSPAAVVVALRRPGVVAGQGPALVAGGAHRVVRAVGRGAGHRTGGQREDGGGARRRVVG